MYHNCYVTIPLNMMEDWTKYFVIILVFSDRVFDLGDILATPKCGRKDHTQSLHSWDHLCVPPILRPEAASNGKSYTICRFVQFNCVSTAR